MSSGVGPSIVVALTACALASLHGQVRQLPLLPAGTTGGAVLQVSDAAVSRMSRSGDLALRTSHADPFLPGRSHERYAQYYRGLPVISGDLARQVDATLGSISAFGHVYEDIGIDPTPALSADDAMRTASAALGSSGATSAIPELVVLPLGPGDYALAYRVRIATPMDRIVAFVDARTGVVLLKYSDLERDAIVGVGTGVFGDRKKVSANHVSGAYVAEDLLRPPDIATFDMHGDVSRTEAFLDGSTALTASDLAASTSNTWTDGPDVDAHAYAGFTYDYYYRRFGRHGLDDRDLPLTVLVHPAARANVATASSDVVGTFYLNAFYAGDGVVVYGEGLPTGLVLSGTRQSVNYFSAGLDIVAHELSHGVTEFTSGLVYVNESGALNEAFSDIMGVSAKFFFDPPGTGLMQANYELGSDVIRPGGIRSFDNPAVFGDPDHYSKIVTGADDNGGVHTNCTVVDHAFYLAIEGGTNRTSGLSVAGVGSANRAQIERIFYRGFTLMLPSNATFSLARAATIQSARDLYGAGSAAEVAVTQAWTAVGVS